MKAKMFKKKLVLEIINVIEELQNTGFRFKTKSLIMKIKTYKLNEETNEADYEVRRIEKLIYDKESKMMQLKSDLEKIEKAKAKVKFIIFAMILFFIVMKCFMI